MEAPSYPWRISAGTELDNETNQDSKPPMFFPTTVTRNLAIARVLCEYSDMFWGMFFEEFGSIYKTRFAWKSWVWACQLLTVFRFYYTISELQLKHTVNSLSFKWLIKKEWTSGTCGRARAHPSHLPSPLGPDSPTHSIQKQFNDIFKYTLSVIESYCELNIPTEKVCQTSSNKITGQVSISKSVLKILDNNPNRKVKTVVLYWTLFRKINKYKKGLFNHAIHDWQNKFRHSIGAAWSWSTNKRFYRQLQS